MLLSYLLIVSPIALFAKESSGVNVVSSEAGITIKHEYINGKHQVSGTIKNGKKVKGDWMIGIGPKDSEAFEDFLYTKKNVTNLSLSYTFDKALEPGEYVAFVKFTGMVDGKLYDEKDGKTNALFASVPVTSKSTDNPTNPVLTIKQEDGDGKHKVTATIKQAKKVKGTWLIGIGSKNTEAIEGFRYSKKDATDLSISHTFDKQLKPGKYIVFAKFMGIVDGKKSALSASILVTIKSPENPVKPVLTAKYKDVNGKHKVSGTIKQAKKVKGTWLIGVGSKDTEAIEGFRYSKKNATDLSVSHTFDKQLKPGEYIVFAKFKGIVDGKKSALSASILVTIKSPENPVKPVLTAKYKDVNGKHKVSGAIKQAKKVKGTWLIGIGSKSSEAIEGFQYIKENATALSLSHTFDKQLKAGEYVAFVKFVGVVDEKVYGENNALFASAPVVIKSVENPVKPVLTVNHEDVNRKHKVSGTIKQAKKVKGTWLIGIGSKSSEAIEGFQYIKENATALSLSHTFDKQLKAGQYVAFVKFVGVVDEKVYGENNALFASTPVVIKSVENPVKPVLTMKHQYVNGKHKVSATIKQAKKVEGTWLIGIGSKSAKVIEGFQYTKENETDLSVSHTFSNQLKAGQYIAFVQFIGVVDGKVYEKNNPLSSSTSFEVKPIPNTSIAGGVLPKTATNYTSAIVGGVVLLLVGTGILLYRRGASRSR
jgi:LPXTG-motif cell wall-anchored protein